MGSWVEKMIILITAMYCSSEAKKITLHDNVILYAALIVVSSKVLSNIFSKQK